MGQITVTLEGSFGPRRSMTFTAMKVGHAQAVADAIGYLAATEMPAAVLNDHQCHRDGIEPSSGFGGLGKVLAPEAA